MALSGFFLESTFKDQINPKRQTAGRPEGGSPELDLAVAVAVPVAVPLHCHWQWPQVCSHCQWASQWQAPATGSLSLSEAAAATRRTRAARSSVVLSVYRAEPLVLVGRARACYSSLQPGRGRPLSGTERTHELEGRWRAGHCKRLRDGVTRTPVEAQAQGPLGAASGPDALRVQLIGACSWAAAGIAGSASFKAASWWLRHCHLTSGAPSHVRASRRVLFGWS